MNVDQIHDERQKANKESKQTQKSAYDQNDHSDNADDAEQGLVGYRKCSEYGNRNNDNDPWC